MKNNQRKLIVPIALGAVLLCTGCPGPIGPGFGSGNQTVTATLPPGGGGIIISWHGTGQALPPPAGYKSWQAFNSNDGGTNPFGSYLDSLGLPAPTGYASWNDYGNDNNIVNGSGVDFDTVPAPTGYSDWDSFNSDPSTPPPSGYATWQDWAAAQLS